MLLSETGVVNGHGTAPYKWVSGLSADERKAVRAGALVFVRDYTAHHYTQCGFKVVSYRSKKYCHREPSAEQLRTLQNYFNAGEQLRTLQNYFNAGSVKGGKNDSA